MVLIVSTHIPCNMALLIGVSKQIGIIAGIIAETKHCVYLTYKLITSLQCQYLIYITSVLPMGLFIGVFGLYELKLSTSIVVYFTLFVNTLEEF